MACVDSKTTLRFKLTHLSIWTSYEKIDHFCSTKLLLIPFFYHHLFHYFQQIHLLIMFLWIYYGSLNPMQYVNQNNYIFLVKFPRIRSGQKHQSMQFFWEILYKNSIWWGIFRDALKIVQLKDTTWFWSKSNETKNFLCLPVTAL